MINVTVKGDREVIQRLKSMPERINAELVRKVTALAIELELKVKRDKLSGQVLNVRTGALRRSIFHQVDRTPHRVVGKVASASDVKYAGIHEFGGRTAPHRIEPRKASVLAFMMNGKQVFAKYVNHPGSQMPVRSFLRSSLKDMRTKIINGLREAVAAGMRP